jgi:peptidoglycan/xylan/chitin deacetylase (PgdA/CDA1 family)
LVKSLLKILIAAVFYYSGLFLIVKLWNYMSGKRLTILTFHRITNEQPSRVGGLPSISLSLMNFESLIKFVLKHYTVISQQEYLEFIRKGKKTWANYLILSFDDAYKEMQEYASVILKKYKLPAILFVPTGIIDDGGFFWWDAAYGLLSGSWDDSQVQKYLTAQPESDSIRTLKKITSIPKSARDQAIYDFLETIQNSSEDLRQKYVDCILKMYDEIGLNKFHISTVLDWQAIKELCRAGIEVGSHTRNHRFLSTLSSDEVTAELVESKSQLEKHTGTPVTSFAYPGGKYNDQVIGLVKKVGYQCAFSADSGINRFEDRMYNLRRINIWDYNVSGGFGKFSKAHTAWTLLFRH